MRSTLILNVFILDHPCWSKESCLGGREPWAATSRHHLLALGMKILIYLKKGVVQVLLKYVYVWKRMMLSSEYDAHRKSLTSYSSEEANVLVSGCCPLYISTIFSSLTITPNQHMLQRWHSNLKLETPNRRDFWPPLGKAYEIQVW